MYRNVVYRDEEGNWRMEEKSFWNEKKPVPICSCSRQTVSDDCIGCFAQLLKPVGYVPAAGKEPPAPAFDARTNGTIVPAILYLYTVYRREELHSRGRYGPQNNLIFLEKLGPFCYCSFSIFL